MDNVDEVEAYKNERGSFDVIMSITNSDGQPTKAIWKNMHLTMELEYDGSVKLVFES